MNLTLTDYLAHVSNILLLISYSVRSILWLRWFAVAAAIIIMPYYLLQPVVLWPPVGWAAVFMAINLLQIWTIYRERRPVVFSDEEKTLYEMGFQSVRPRDFLSLVLIGEWRDAVPGERLIVAGETVSSISILISGRLRVMRGPDAIGELGPGQAVGSALAMLGDRSPVDMIFAERARYISWRLTQTRAFLERKPELRHTLQRMVNRELAQKIQLLAAR